MFDAGHDLPKQITVTQKFFERSLAIFFGLTLNEVRYSSVIKREELKILLKSAEEYIDKKNYLDAVIMCRDAFENALFFKKEKDSLLNILSVPALLELKNTHRYLYVYIRELNSKYELNTLGIDARLYEQFKEYLDHIPKQYRVDDPYKVMQRPWSKDDALFCYGFVSETIFKWEAAEMKPLYVPEPFVDNYSWEEYIGNVHLKQDFEGGCHYSFDKENEIIYFFGNETTIGKIKNELKENHIYRYNLKHFKNDRIKLDLSYYCKITSVDYTLISNAPARWGIMIWIQILPLTYYRTGYSDGKISEPPLDINTCTFSDLIGEGVSETAATKIVKHFQSRIISDVSQLASTGGISNKDREIIATSFFSKPVLDALSLQSEKK